MGFYYPPAGFHFLVSFNLDGAGGHDTRFREVSGIEVELETRNQAEGGENRFVHTLPTRPRYSNLVLKRGLLTDSAVISWCRNAIENLDIRPVSVQVALLNENHEPLQTYDFQNAWPRKWSLSGFNAEESSLVVETLELVYQYFNVR